MPTTEIVCRYPVSDGDGLFRECGGAALYQVGALPEPACARCRDVYLACAAKAAAMLGGEDDPDAASGLHGAAVNAQGSSMPVTCGYVEREGQRDIQCGEVAGPGGYCERHGAMVAASSLTLDDIAKALGDDATLHVERRPGGSWNAEVNYMGEVIGDGGSTLAEAVAAALADLAVQRRRDLEKQLREALRDVLTHVVDLPEAQVCSESEANARALDRKIAADRAILVARKLIGERR